MKITAIYLNPETGELLFYNTFTPVPSSEPMDLEIDLPSPDPDFLYKGALVGHVEPFNPSSKFKL